MKFRRKAALTGVLALSATLLIAPIAHAVDGLPEKQELRAKSIQQSEASIALYSAGSAKYAFLGYDHSRDLLAEVTQLTDQGIPLNVLVSAKHGTILRYEIGESAQ